MAKATRQTTQRDTGRDMQAKNVDALIEHWQSILIARMDDMMNSQMPDTAERFVYMSEAAEEIATISKTIALLMTLLPLPSRCPSCDYDIMAWAQNESRERRIHRDHHDDEQPLEVRW